MFLILLDVCGLSDEWEGLEGGGAIFPCVNMFRALTRESKTSSDCNFCSVTSRPLACQLVCNNPRGYLVYIVDTQI